MSQKIDVRQLKVPTAAAMIGVTANDTLDTVIPKINNELAKLFEDRNMSLADGGIITFPAAGTSITFTQALKLHINSQVAGGAPTVVDLAATTRTLSANGRMVYAVVNRTAGTATVTDDSATLPAQTSANQEVVLIAKRVDSGDGTKRVYFINEFSLSAGQSSRLGSSGTQLATEFSVVDPTDTTKKMAVQTSGATTATKTTLNFTQSVDRQIDFPDAADTVAVLAAIQNLSNKRLAFSTSTDSTTTGTNTTAAAFTTGVIRLTNASLVSVSGLPAGGSSQMVIIENKTGNQISINNEETTATAANRIQTGNNSNVSMQNNASFAFIYDTTSARWQLVGGTGSASSGSGKNYLSVYTASTASGVPNTGNGDFEAGSTTGWALGTIGTLTNGLPTGTPTFGSGASGNLSIAVVSSAQLAGLYSLSYASSAATTVGNMLASSAFFIDLEDQAKVLSYKFTYKAQTNPANANWSGTSSNSYGVAVWDVTNSVWLSSTGNFGMTQSSGAGYATGTFQTASNTTQIRFVIYNVNATSGAVTVYFDDIFVGPQIAQSGLIPKASTVQKFTSGTTYTTPAGVYAIRVTLVGGGGGGGASGTTPGTAATAGSNTTFGPGTANGGGQGFNGTASQSAGSGGSGSLTTSGTVFLVKLAPGNGGVGMTNSSVAGLNFPGGAGGGSAFFGGGATGGYGAAVNTGATNSGGGGSGGGNQGGTGIPTGGGGGGGGSLEFIILNPSATYSFSVGGGGTGGVAGTSGTAGGNGAAGQILVEEYYYGTNVQLSSDTDTRVVGFLVGGPAGTPSGSGADVSWTGGVSTDTHSGFNGTTTYTAPISGYYDIRAKFTLGGTWALGNIVDCAILVNGGVISRQEARAAGAVTNMPGNIQLDAYKLNAGDTVKIQLTSGATSPTFAGGSTYNQFSIKRISGPSIIAANEAVNMRYGNSSSQSLVNATLVTITSWTKDFDSHNAMNASSGVYTIPVSGKYLVTAHLEYVFNATGGRGLLFVTAGSNARTFLVGQIPASNTDTSALSGSEIISFLAGDTILVQGFQRSGGNLAISSNSLANSFCIARVGN